MPSILLTYLSSFPEGETVYIYTRYLNLRLANEKATIKV